MTPAERRRQLAELLRIHWRTPTSGCECGGMRLGEDYCLHVADEILAAAH